MAEDNLKSFFDRMTDVVDDAIAQSDYSNLSAQIADLVDDVAELARGFASPGQEAARKEALRRKALKVAQEEREKEARRKREEEQKRADRYFVRPDDSVGTTALSILGSIGGMVFGVITIVAATLHFTTAAAFFGILSVAGAGLAVKNTLKAKRNRRYLAYRQILLPKLYEEVRDIAVAVNLPEKEVVKDLEKLSKEGMIREGHFDEKKTTFIASDELYEQYRASVEREIGRQPKTTAAPASASGEAAEAPIPEKIRPILEKGNQCIAMIREANDNIPDPDVTAKLNRMEEIVRRIFAEVRKRPELADKLNLFLTYYLPTTTKLVNAYEEMDRQPVQGENIRKAKSEISNSLSTINDAYEKLLDSFFLRQAEDVTSDINVMKMMMQQEGLAPDEMSAMRKKQDAQFAKTAFGDFPGTGQQNVQTSGGVQTQSSGGAQAQMQMKEQ